MVEAAIVFANEVLVCFLFPIHIGVHRVYHLFTTVIHNGKAPCLRDSVAVPCPFACLPADSLHIKQAGPY